MCFGCVHGNRCVGLQVFQTSVDGLLILILSLVFKKNEDYTQGFLKNEMMFVTETTMEVNKKIQISITDGKLIIFLA